MRKYIITAIVLTLICSVAAVLLAFVNKITEPVIAEYEKNVILNALKEVSCGYEIGEQKIIEGNASVEDYYELSENGMVKGYLLSLKGKGYGGELTVVASFDTEGKVMDAKLASNGETPGVGKKAENKGYMDKFIGKGTDVSIPTKKNMLTEKETAEVSGATMTFTGVSKALTAGSEFVKELGGAR